MANLTIYDLTFRAALPSDEVEIQATSAGVSYKTTVSSITSYALTQVTSPVITGALGFIPVNQAGDTMVGVLSVKAGTAALPGLAFSGDPNTGLFSIAGDSISATAAGVERLRIDATGNVGIGAGSVTGYGAGYRMLEVKGHNSTDGGVVRVQSSGAEIAADLFVNSNVFGGAILRTITAHPVIFGINGGERVRVDTNGDIKLSGGRIYGTALHNNSSGMSGATSQYVGSGTYTPTLTAVTNCSSPTLNDNSFRYTRVGNVVEVSGTFTLTTTAANTSTQLDISLPIASNMTTAIDLSGNGSCRVTSAATYPGYVTANFTNDRASFFIYAHAASSNSYSVSFSYEVK